MSRSRLVHAAAVLLGFAILFGWIFGGVLTSGRLLAESDLFDQYLPLFLSPPLVWSPYEFGGVPAFADPENSMFYPVRWLFTQVVQSWNGFLISAFVLAACFSYAYLWFHTRSWRAATIGALTFVLSEAMIERLPHANILHALPWIPLLLLAIDAMRTGNRWWWGAVAAVAGASCILAGHPQLPVYIAYLAGTYAVVGLLKERAPAAVWVGTMAAGLGAVVLAAASLLPLVELSGQTVRQPLGFNDFTDYANSPWQMLSTLFPVISHPGLEAPTYVGLLSLLLALCSLTMWRHDWRVAFWVIVAVGALLLGMGASTPLAAAVYRLPLYDHFRIVSRHLVFAAFALSVLAAYGAGALERGAVSRRAMIGSTVTFGLLLLAAAVVVARWPDRVRFDHIDESSRLPWFVDGIWMQLGVAAMAVLCVMVLWSRRTARVAWGGAAVLLTFDLLHGSAYALTPSGLNLVTVPASALQPGPRARWLADLARSGDQRFVSITGSLRDDIVPGLFARPWAMPSAGGYTSLLLSNVSFAAQVSAGGRVAPAALLDGDSGLDLLAVRYAIVRRDVAVPADLAALTGSDRWHHVERFLVPAVRPEDGAGGSAPDREYDVYENRRALPRAWMVSEVLPVTDGALADAIRTGRLRDGRRFEPVSTALVDEGALPPAQSAASGPVQIVSRESGRVTLQVTSDTGGFVVLSEAYYPGWAARIDGGAPQPVYRTDLALQGTPVPAGRHLIVFEFSSRARQLGLAISAGGTVLWLGALVAAYRRARGRTSPPMRVIAA